MTSMALRLFLCIATVFLPFAAAASDKPKVVTTFTIIADMARNVAGDAADVELSLIHI